MSPTVAKVLLGEQGSDDEPHHRGRVRGRKFSEVAPVASRNSLYQILAVNVALGTEEKAKSSSPAALYVPGRGREGEIATANFGEFHFFYDVW